MSPHPIFMEYYKDLSNVISSYESPTYFMFSKKSSRQADYLCDGKIGCDDNDGIAADIAINDNDGDDNDDAFNVISPDEIIFTESDKNGPNSKLLPPHLEEIYAKSNFQDSFPIHVLDNISIDFPSTQDTNSSETCVPPSQSDCTTLHPTTFIKAMNEDVPTNTQPLLILECPGPDILQECQIQEERKYFNTDKSTAENEWDNLQVITFESEDSKRDIYIKHDKGDVPLDIQPTDFAFQEALEHFQSIDMSYLKPKIHMSIERKGLSALTNFLFGPPKLSHNLLTAKEFVFCLAATTFDNDNQIHLKSLFAVYRNLTGRKMNCSRYGHHWEEIGFQGSDPSTDLRAVGLLGLLHLLYLTSKPQLNTLKEKMYCLSSHKTQNFPFCVMGLNVTKLVLQALRSDRLNKLCNKQGDVISVVNDVFVATYFKIYHIWKYQHKTIVDSGFVLKDVEGALKKNIPSMLIEVEEYLKKPEISVSTNCKQVSLSSSTATSTKHNNFTGVSDLINNC